MTWPQPLARRFGLRVYQDLTRKVELNINGVDPGLGARMVELKSKMKKFLDLTDAGAPTSDEQVAYVSYICEYAETLAMLAAVGLTR